MTGVISFSLRYSASFGNIPYLCIRRNIYICTYIMDWQCSCGFRIIINIVIGVWTRVAGATTVSTHSTQHAKPRWWNATPKITFLNFLFVSWFTIYGRDQARVKEWERRRVNGSEITWLNSISWHVSIFVPQRVSHTHTSLIRLFYSNKSIFIFGWWPLWCVSVAPLSVPLSQSQAILNANGIS